MVGSHYGSLEYANLEKELQITKRYLKEYMEVTA